MLIDVTWELMGATVRMQWLKVSLQETVCLKFNVHFVFFQAKVFRYLLLAERTVSRVVHLDILGECLMVIRFWKKRFLTTYCSYSELAFLYWSSGGTAWVDSVHGNWLTEAALSLGHLDTLIIHQRCPKLVAIYQSVAVSCLVDREFFWPLSTFSCPLITTEGSNGAQAGFFTYRSLCTKTAARKLTVAALLLGHLDTLTLHQRCLNSCSRATSRSRMLLVLDENLFASSMRLNSATARELVYSPTNHFHEKTNAVENSRCTHADYASVRSYLHYCDLSKLCYEFCFFY